MIAIDLSKQQVLDADPRASQQINFTANLDRADNTTLFFIVEDCFGLFTRNCKSFVCANECDWVGLIFINIKRHNATI